MRLGNCDLLSRLLITDIVTVQMIFAKFRSGIQGGEEVQYHPSR